MVHSTELSSSLLPSETPLLVNTQKLCVFQLSKRQHKQQIHIGPFPLLMLLLIALCCLCILFSNQSKNVMNSKKHSCDWICYGALEWSNRNVVAILSGNCDHASAIHYWGSSLSLKQSNQSWVSISLYMQKSVVNVRAQPWYVSWAAVQLASQVLNETYARLNSLVGSRGATESWLVGANWHNDQIGRKWRKHDKKKYKNLHVRPHWQKLTVELINSQACVWMRAHRCGSVFA